MILNSLGGHDCVGIGGLDENVIGSYLLFVNAIGLNSLLTLHMLEEGCYPLDVDERNLERLGTLDHQDMSAFDTLLVNPALSRSNRSLFVFGDNCD